MILSCCWQLYSQQKARWAQGFQIRTEDFQSQAKGFISLLLSFPLGILINGKWQSLAQALALSELPYISSSLLHHCLLAHRIKPAGLQEDKGCLSIFTESVHVSTCWLIWGFIFQNISQGNLRQILEIHALINWLQFNKDTSRKGGWDQQICG